MQHENTILGQTPSFYNYCGNNPVSFNDADGKVFFLVPILIGAAVGGTINLGIQAALGSVNNFGDGLSAFGVGALAGAASVAVPQLMTSYGETIAGVSMTTATGGIAGGFYHGAVAGGIGGMITGFGNGLLLEDKNMGESLKGGATGFGVGAFSGGIIYGAISKYYGETFSRRIDQSTTFVQLEKLNIPIPNQRGVGQLPEADIPNLSPKLSDAVIKTTSNGILNDGGKQFVSVSVNGGEEMVREIPSNYVKRIAENGNGWVWEEIGSTENSNTIRVGLPDVRDINGYIRIYNEFGQSMTILGKPGSDLLTQISLIDIMRIQCWPK